MCSAIADMWNKYVTPMFSAATNSSAVVQGDTQRLSALTAVNSDPTKLALARPTAEVVSHTGGESRVADLDLERQRRLLQPGLAPQQQQYSAVG